jgi:hypothetical protein
MSTVFNTLTVKSLECTVLSVVQKTEIRKQRTLYMPLSEEQEQEQEQAVGIYQQAFWA